MPVNLLTLNPYLTPMAVHPTCQFYIQHFDSYLYVKSLKWNLSLCIWNFKAILYTHFFFFLGGGGEERKNKWFDTCQSKSTVWELSLHQELAYTLIMYTLIKCTIYLLFSLGGSKVEVELFINLSHTGIKNMLKIKQKIVSLCVNKWN